MVALVKVMTEAEQRVDENMGLKGGEKCYKKVTIKELELRGAEWPEIGSVVVIEDDGVSDSLNSLVREIQGQFQEALLVVSSNRNGSEKECLVKEFGVRWVGYPLDVDELLGVVLEEERGEYLI